MRQWDDLDLENKITDILMSAQAYVEPKHMEMHFLTAYQIALTFAQRHPTDVAALNLPAGTTETGRYTGLAKYFAERLSMLVQIGDYRFEGTFLSDDNLREMSFADAGVEDRVLLSSPVSPSNADSALRMVFRMSAAGWWLRIQSQKQKKYRKPVPSLNALGKRARINTLKLVRQLIEERHKVLRVTVNGMNGGVFLIPMKAIDIAHHILENEIAQWEALTVRGKSKELDGLRMVMGFTEEPDEMVVVDTTDEKGKPIKKKMRAIDIAADILRDRVRRMKKKRA